MTAAFSESAPVDLAAMTRTALLEMAAGLGLTGLNAAKKAEIIHAIEAVC